MKNDDDLPTDELRAFLKAADNQIGPVLQAIAEACGTGATIDTGQKIIGGMDVTDALVIVGKVFAFLTSVIPKDVREESMAGWFSACMEAAEVLANRSGKELSPEDLERTRQWLRAQHNGGAVFEDGQAVIQAKSGEPTSSNYIETDAKLLLSASAGAVLKTLQEECRPELSRIKLHGGSERAAEIGLDLVGALQVLAEVIASIFSIMPAELQPVLSNSWCAAMQSRIEDAAKETKIVSQHEVKQTMN